MTMMKNGFWTVAVPLAALMVFADAGLRAQEPTDQPMVSRSGIDLAALDRSADPCSDFYQMWFGGSVRRLLPVCVRWMASKPPHPAESAAVWPLRRAAGSQPRDPQEQTGSR